MRGGALAKNALGTLPASVELVQQPGALAIWVMGLSIVYHIHLFMKGDMRI